MAVQQDKTAAVPPLPNEEPASAVAASSSPDPVKSVFLIDEFGTETVTLEVGSGATTATFVIHKKILCSKVLYFDRMFNGAFVESTTQSAKFPEDHPLPFKYLLAWVYKNQIEPPQPATAEGSYGVIEQRQLLLAFALAEKLGVALFQDAIMDFTTLYLTAMNCFPTEFQIFEAYNAVPSGSRLRLFLARVFVYITMHLGSDSLWKNDDMFKIIAKCNDLGLHAYSMLRNHGDNPFPDPRLAFPCHYHQHPLTEPCPALKKLKAEGLI